MQVSVLRCGQMCCTVDVWLWLCVRCVQYGKWRSGEWQVKCGLWCAACEFSVLCFVLFVAGLVRIEYECV